MRHRDFCQVLCGRGLEPGFELNEGQNNFLMRCIMREALILGNTIWNVISE